MREFQIRDTIICLYCDGLGKDDTLSFESEYIVQDITSMFNLPAILIDNDQQKESIFVEDRFVEVYQYMNFMENLNDLLYELNMRIC